MKWKRNCRIINQVLVWITASSCQCHIIRMPPVSWSACLRVSLSLFTVVKQRMQVFNSPYKTCLECLTRVYRAEGLRAFYRSYVTQLSMNIPFQSIHFMVYEFCQDHLNPERRYNPHTHWMSGAMAGAVAAGATTPLDVCKTLLNTQEKCAITRASGGSVDGLAQAFRTVYQYQGVTGYFRGVSARVIYQMPSTAISWSVYEFFKYRITQSQNVNCDGYVVPPSVPKVHCSPTVK